MVMEICMKRVMKGTLAIVIIVSLLLGMASCGGGNGPKSLAKQTVDLISEMTKLSDDDILARQKKLEAINEKVEQLSDTDKKIYNDEVDRLVALKKW
jgi:sensor histidine kinase YesM